MTAAFLRLTSMTMSNYRVTRNVSGQCVREQQPLHMLPQLVIDLVIVFDEEVERGTSQKGGALCLRE